MISRIPLLRKHVIPAVIFFFALVFLSPTTLLAEEIERMLRQHLDVDAQLAIVEIDAPPGAVLDPSADFALDLRRGEREPLVGSLRPHAKRSGPAIVQVAAAPRSLIN